MDLKLNHKIHFFESLEMEFKSKEAMELSKKGKEKVTNINYRYNGYLSKKILKSQPDNLIIGLNGYKKDFVS